MKRLEADIGDINPYLFMKILVDFGVDSPNPLSPVVLKSIRGNSFHNY